jgi:hypothetical protein
MGALQSTFDTERPSIAIAAVPGCNDGRARDGWFMNLFSTITHA